MFFESVVNSVKSARGHSPPKRHSASLRRYGSAHFPYLTSLCRCRVRLRLSLTVLSISNTQLCFASPWLSDSTHFISITTLLISFPLLCHSLPSHRLSTPFHRFASHFNSAATFLRHADTKLLLCTTPLRHPKAHRRYALTSHSNPFALLVCAIPKRYTALLYGTLPMRIFTLIFIAFSSRRFTFPALRISAPFRIITSLLQRTADSSVRYFAISQLSNTFPGPLFASPAPCPATLFRSITVFSLPLLREHFNTIPLLYGVCYTTPALNNSLTVQIHFITCLCHVSSKLCFSIS